MRGGDESVNLVCEFCGARAAYWRVRRRGEDGKPPITSCYDCAMIELKKADVFIEQIFKQGMGPCD